MQDSVKQDRHKYIGGSDIACIMGISPFKTRWQLLQEKAQIVEDDFKGNVYTEYGNNIEASIRDYINETIGKIEGKVFVEGKHVEEGEIIGFRSHTDGECEDEILEVKSTGSDNIHEDLDAYGLYLVQELWYMHRTKKQFGTLAVYERPEDLSLVFDPDRLHVFRFDIDDYEGLVEKIDTEVGRFIVDLARLKKNPFLEEQDFIPPELIEISDKIALLETKLAEMKVIEKQVEGFKATLKKEMQEHNVKNWRTPTGISITLVDDAPDKVTEEDELDIEQIKKDLPELFKSEAEGGYMRRVQKTKKGRKGYVLITLPKEK